MSTCINTSRPHVERQNMSPIERMTRGQKSRLAELVDKNTMFNIQLDIQDFID